MGELVAAITAAFIGAGSAIGWEAWLKPRRERVKVAKTLRVEVADIRQSLIAVREHAAKTGGALPLDFMLPTTAFDSLLGSVGELRSAEIVSLIALYSRVTYLNHLTDSYRRLRERHDSAARGSILSQQLDEQMTLARVAFFDTVETAASGADSAFAALDRIPGPKERLGAPRLAVEAYEARRQADLRKKQGATE